MLLLLTARQQQRIFPKIRCTKERGSNEGCDKPHGSKSWKARCELSFERRGRIGSLAKPFDPIAKQTPTAMRTSRDSGEIICSSQAVVYAKTHRHLHRRRNSYSRVTELPSLRLLFLSLSSPVGCASFLQFLGDEVQSYATSVCMRNCARAMLRNEITSPMTCFCANPLSPQVLLVRLL